MSDMLTFLGCRSGSLMAVVSLTGEQDNAPVR
jgi:hypothetical protein